MTDKPTRFVVTALQYIRNTNGYATIANFDEDHEPIGPMLRRDIDGYFHLVGDKMFLTERGVAVLEASDG